MEHQELVGAPLDLITCAWPRTFLAVDQLSSDVGELTTEHEQASKRALMDLNCALILRLT